MQVIVSFAGRGVTVHEGLDAQGNEAYSLLMNLRDGIGKGRVRWFAVVGAGVSERDVLVNLAEMRDRYEQGMVDLQTRAAADERRTAMREELGGREQ